MSSSEGDGHVCSVEVGCLSVHLVQVAGLRLGEQRVKASLRRPDNRRAAFLTLVIQHLIVLLRLVMAVERRRAAGVCFFFQILDEKKADFLSTSRSLSESD